MIPGTAWFKLPDETSDAVAALANCAAATAAAVLRYAGPIADQRVLIMGAGVLGTLACAMAAASDARQIIAVDGHAACRKRAKQFGRDARLRRLRCNSTDVRARSHRRHRSRRCDGTRRQHQSIQSLLALVRLGGTVVLAGAVANCDPVALDPESIVRRMITVRGVHNYHPRDLQSGSLPGDGGCNVSLRNSLCGNVSSESRRRSPEPREHILPACA